MPIIKPPRLLSSILYIGKMPAARSGLWLTTISSAAYFALFRLPFWFPPRQQLVSASFAFGFNNGVAIVGMTVLLGAVTLYLLRWCRVTISELPITFQLTGDSGQKSLIVGFTLIVVFYAALTFLMYLYNVQSAPWLMWETRHLLHRTWLMDVYGLRPYTEVAAEYGPILTYAPLYIYWLLKPIGASHEQAYFACHFLLNIGGLWCAYYVLSHAIMPARARLIAFAVLAVAGFAPYMGINGVLPRYLFPFASLLLGHRAVIWMLSTSERTARWIIFGTTGLFLLLLMIGNILLSSEAGVAFAIAWLGYALLMVRCEVRVLAISLIALITVVLLSWLFLPTAYYGTLLRFSEGANNLPLLPAAHLLLYILTLFVVVPPLLVVGLWERLAGSVPGAAICGAFGVLCVAMAPGALGRCDPPHVLFYGMGAAMLLLIRLANISRPAFAAYTVAYAAVFIVLMQVVNLQAFYRISPRMLLACDVANVTRAVRTATSTSHPSVATLAALDRYPRLGLPFASFGDPAVERYVLSRHQLEPEYYVSIVGIYNEAALERKVRDVAKMEYLLVPRGWAYRRDSNSCDRYLKDLRDWFLYPAALPCRAKPLDPVLALTSFIAAHYVPVEKVGSWFVLRRTNIVPGAWHDQ